jgi:SAM-dependent methyltransferase
MSNLPDFTNLPFSPAAERNKQPILEVLQRVLPATGSALEIASGTGQHAAFFASAFPGWTWQPTDADPAGLPLLAAFLRQAGQPNVREPMHLDVLAAQWPAPGAAFTQPFDAIYCANMLHISPWATCAALMQGSARHLAPGGVLITYGPYLDAGVPTSPGNRAFDESLRDRDAAWGIRQLDDVTEQARLAGLRLRERHAMPANNLLLVWERSPSL